jgi:hypothetical protein
MRCFFILEAGFTNIILSSGLPLLKLLEGIYCWRFGSIVEYSLDLAAGEAFYGE